VDREKLSEHFYRDEFACKGKNCCNGSSPVSRELIEGLEEFRSFLRDYIGFEVSVFIDSGFRCNKHNKEIVGAKYSAHQYGEGVDISTGVSISAMYECALKVEKFLNGGIGLYQNRLHLDIGKKRRWEDFE